MAAGVNVPAITVESADETVADAGARMMDGSGLLEISPR